MNPACDPIHLREVRVVMGGAPIEMCLPASLAQAVLAMVKRPLISAMPVRCEVSGKHYWLEFKRITSVTIHNGAEVGA